MIATSTIEWKPFSAKHKRYIRRALSCRMSVAEGAIRSGKTIDHCIIAAAYLETCKDKIHLASGSTAANAKLNIGACNGYGLENLFRGRCRWGAYRGNDCLYVQTKTGEKIVVFAGGMLANSYKKILGNSYGLWIATEINQHYDADDSETSFIKVAMGRQLAAESPMILWDLNPSAPRHKIYEEYIDKYREEGLLGGYNYEHFTIADNLSITEQRRREIEAQYDKNSIWYRRDILGQRCVAEGIIYRQFADNPEAYAATDEDKAECMLYNVGVDFGGTGSATTFVLTGFTKGLQAVIPIRSERHEEELNPEELNELFANFIHACYNITGGKPMNVYADSAEQILIRGLRRTVQQRGLRCIIHDARKCAINDRIRLVNSLIARGRFRVAEGAQTVTDALCEALWDSKHDDTRLDDGTTDIDTMDALEYSIEPYMAELSRF